MEPSTIAAGLAGLASARGLLLDSELAEAVPQAATSEKWVKVLERAYQDAANGDPSAREFLLAAEVMCW